MPPRESASQRTNKMAGRRIAYNSFLSREDLSFMEQAPRVYPITAKYCPQREDGPASLSCNYRIYFTFSSFLAFSKRSSFTYSFAFGGLAIFPMPYFTIMSVETCTCCTVTS